MIRRVLAAFRPYWRRRQGDPTEEVPPELCAAESRKAALDARLRELEADKARLEGLRRRRAGQGRHYPETPTT